MRTIIGLVVGCMVWAMVPVRAQKIDDARMERDIKVAENVLQTLIRQQFDGQRMFFGLNVSGSYQPGYGVTFRLPADFTTPIAFSVSGNVDGVRWMDGQAPGAYSYSFSTSPREKKLEEELARTEAETTKLKAKAARPREVNLDSLHQAYNEQVIRSSKDFLVDYGDMISQLGASEKIVITNRGEQPRVWVNQFFNAPKRSYLSIEISKADIQAHKQGKLTRDQALAKISVVNTESVEAVEPDLELLSSIFNRLYRSDLATTFFADEGIYYERLKDFGAVYYMRVYSSNQSRNSGLFNMPTVNLSEVDQTARDKKVKEMYPAFEKELKENLIEYGRTVKSLADNESLVLNVRLTKCDGCGIPATLELSVKGAVLKEFASGKTTKDAALGKISTKKGALQ
jgi:hypothetical protein